MSKSLLEPLPGTATEGRTQGQEIFEVPSASLDFRTELAAQLAELVPEIVADGKVDIEKLRELLAEDTADGSERFGLFWPGKKRALRAAQAPTTATLKPDFANSKDWDTTQNVFIEGDNLEVLKILQRHYHNKIKLIYIDPPYNTGKDFVYPDNYVEGLQTYLEWTKQVSAEGKKVSSNSETEGRYHSNWLNMMYPRLKLARNLLTDNGVIFISIDDNEVANLRRLCDEVFGESNFVAELIWEGANKNDAKQIGIAHEYVLLYARRREALPRRWSLRKEGVEPVLAEVRHLQEKHGDNYNSASQELAGWFRSMKATPSFGLRRFRYIDKRGAYKEDDPTAPGGRRFALRNPTTGQVIPLRPNRGWGFDQVEFDRLVAEERISFITQTSVMVRRYLHETDAITPPSVFYQPARSASERLGKLMGANVFEFPKDETILAKLIEMACPPSDFPEFVLDFFAGASTTAHAVMNKNSEDGGKRRFIMVQLPEPTPEDSEARKAGFATIADISRKRIERAGAKIKADSPLTTQNLDTGFRAYKLADTNFAKWRVESSITPDKLEETLKLFKDSAADNATADDLLTELLLKMGFPLTAKIEKLEIARLEVRRVFDEASGKRVLAYLNEHVKPTLKQLRALVAAEPARLVVLEDTFHGDDELKTNLAQECKSRNVELWTA